MTQNEKQLWASIEAFKLDEKDAQLTFSERLARENGWDMKYTYRVIDEYKKFIFFCCVSPSPVTPSDPVDQAWHLHLTYTKSYWNDFCRDTLQRDIHHNPTNGGESEKEKFSNYYTSTQILYSEKFGQQPPHDIWPDDKTRFSDINFRRVNTTKYWTLQKSALQQLIKWISAIIFISILYFTGVPATIVIILAAIFVLGLLWFNSNNEGQSNGRSCSGGGCDGVVRFFNSDDSGSGCNADSGDSGCSGCGGCGGD